MELLEIEGENACQCIRARTCGAWFVWCGNLCGNWYVHSELHCSVCMSMRQWCLLVKRRSRGLRVRRTHSLHWIVRVCSRLVHEVVEVTKLLGSLYLCGCFLRERCDACNLQHHGVRQWCPSKVSKSRIVFSVWKSRMMQDETRHCEMMQDKSVYV